MVLNKLNFNRLACPNLKKPSADSNVESINRTKLPNIKKEENQSLPKEKEDTILNKRDMVDKKNQYFTKRLKLQEKLF